MKKILFVVLSCTEPFTLKAELVIRSTWGKTVSEVPGCDVVYVRETEGVTYFENNTLYVTSKIGHEYIFTKMYKAFVWLYLNKKFDYIVRVNTSTWCNVKEIVKFIRTKAVPGVFYGGLGLSVRSVNFCMPYLNGNALVMPKECVKVILERSYFSSDRTHIDDVIFSYFWNQANGLEYLSKIQTLGNYFYLGEVLDPEVFSKYFFIQVKNFTTNDRSEENTKLVECDLVYNQNPVEVSPRIDMDWFSGDEWCKKTGNDLENAEGFHTDSEYLVSKEDLQKKLEASHFQPSFNIVSVS